MGDIPKAHPPRSLDTLDDEIVAALKGISKRSAKPQAQLIRDALRIFTRSGNPPPLIFG
jgi:hypothetical protein